MTTTPVVDPGGRVDPRVDHFVAARSRALLGTACVSPVNSQAARQSARPRAGTYWLKSIGPPHQVKTR